MEMNQVLLAGTFFIGSVHVYSPWFWFQKKSVCNHSSHEDLGVSSTFTTCFLGFLLSFRSYFLWFGFFGSAFFYRFFFPQTFRSCSPNPPPPWQCLEAGYHASSDSRQWHDSGNRPWQLQGVAGEVRLLGEWLVMFLYPKNMLQKKPRGFLLFGRKKKIHPVLNFWSLMIFV